MDRLVTNCRSLEEVSHVLQLLYYRNKNQHRLTKWWKWLCMLRRCIPKLLVKFHSHSKTEFPARVRYLQQILLPRCYRWDPGAMLTSVGAITYDSQKLFSGRLWRSICSTRVGPDCCHRQDWRIVHCAWSVCMAIASRWSKKNGGRFAARRPRPKCASISAVGACRAWAPAGTITNNNDNF